MCQPFHNMWHHQGLTRIIKKKLKYASANALKMCAPGITQFSTHTEIHRLAERALPEKMCLYRHAVLMYKLFNDIICENEFINLNFQLYENDKSQKLTFTKNQRFDVGKNIILNRFCDLKNLIDKSWLNLSLETFKEKCKTMFLKWNE